MASAKRSRILGDHKQMGKRFIPPLLQHITPEDIEWIPTIVPEFLWIGALIRRYDLARAVNISLTLAQSASSVHPNPPVIWFARTAAFALLSDESKSILVADLRSKGVLNEIQESLYPITYFYPELPLSFLLSDYSGLDIIPDLKDVIDLVEGMCDRYSRIATIVQSSAVYIAGVTRVFTVVRGVRMPNLEEVILYPDTQNSREEAVVVRAIINGLFGLSSEIYPPKWQQYFWNRGLQISPCSTTDTGEWS